MASWMQQIRLLCQDFYQVPTYHLLLEAFLFLWIIWLLVRRVSARRRTAEVKLTREEEEELLAEWKPEPLVSVDHGEYDHVLDVPVIDHKPGKFLIIDGKECLNLATHNYLGFAGHDDVVNAAVDCAKIFGVGSCGPRAFYGTADVHIHLEEKLAAFLSAEQAVLYSYGFATLASALPAYAKKGDIIFADERINFALQKGVDASRSKVKYFRHNDYDHLEQLLEQQSMEDKKHPKSAKIRRKFLLVEAIYINTGLMCPIEKMVMLKHKYKLRLFIDESVSFASLGAHGKGITEHKSISWDDIDLIMATLEYGVGSIGGFCVGTGYVVEHQTLAGLGYCFSASLPPMLASGALKAIQIMEENPSMFEDLHHKCELMGKFFSEMPGLELSGHGLSPVKHLRLEEKHRLTRRDDIRLLSSIVGEARDGGVGLTLASYLEDMEVCAPAPSIRLTCSVLLSVEDIVHAADVLKDICQRRFSG